MVLFGNDKKYIQYIYNSETEFERDVVKNARCLFGDKTIYIDVKKRLKGKYNRDTVPDGYLFDYTFNDSPKLYFVENELIKHGVREHICPQLLQFSLNYKYNMMELKDLLISNIIEMGTNLDEIARSYSYRNADDMFTSIIMRNDLNVIVPIDEITDELKEAITNFKFNIDLREFKKYVCNNEVIYTFEPFNDEPVMSARTIKVRSEQLDTIIVPAEEEGFKREFLGNNCWYAISIGINMLDKLKYIVAYQKSPIGALTYYAEISKISLYRDTGKYIIYFKDKAKKLNIQIPLNKSNPNHAPQGRVYTNFGKIVNANEKTTLDNIF